MNKIRLKWRIFGFLLGFCLILLIILWLFQIVFLNDFYRHIRISEIRNSASIIISHINDDDLPEIVTALSEEGDFIADIVNMEGRSMLRRTRPDITRNTALIANALESGGEFYGFSTLQPYQMNRFHPTRRIDDRRQPYRRLIRRPTELLAYARLVDNRAVIINAVVSPVHATVTTLRYQLYVISGIMLIFAVILAIIIAKRVSMPIEEISHSALDLAKGRYDTRFSGKGFFEIVELSETLNTTAAELGRVEALRREFLANMSHDLRTPLTLIYSYAEMMRDFPSDITQEQVGVIMEETTRLTGLVNDLLDISKLEANMERLDIDSFSITKNIGETIERLRELLKDQGYTIEFKRDDVVVVEADEAKINRAFYNLLVNAVNYTGADRKILVTQTISDTHVKISVTDSGEGISKADLPFIWDRYYKCKTHKRAVAGTGLGLSIVKKVIELHRGEYGATSEIGKGSTFWFELRKSSKSSK